MAAWTALLQTKVADAGDFQLGEDQMEGLMNDFGDNFAPDRATGASLDDIMRPEPVAAAVAPAVSGPSASSMACFAASGTGSSRALPTFPSFSRFVPAQTAPPVKRAGGSGTIAAPKQAASADASSAAKKAPQRGRPRQSLVDRAQEIRGKFMEASPSDARFFGAEKNAQAKATIRVSTA